MKAEKLVLYVFIDALGWEIYREYGFLKELLPYCCKLETTFGFSSAADPSILTGRYPDEHTHWSSFIYDPANSPFRTLKFLSLLPEWITNKWRIRHYLSKIVKLKLGYTGYFQLYLVPFQYLPYFDYLEKRDYFVPGGILQTDTIFDWCVQQNIPYYCSNWRHSEDQILAENMQIISQGKSRFNYVYLPKLDAIMHEYGPHSLQTKEKLHWLEEQVQKLFDLAKKVYQKVSLYVISDHGMAPVNKECDLMSTIHNTGLVYGKDYVAFYDSTMARFWFLNPNCKDKIISALTKIDSGKIINETDLREMRVLFPHNKFGEMYFLMNEGILINPSFMGRHKVLGMHGYHPKEKYSYAMIASNQPLEGNLTSITQIRKTMESELVTG